jgi:hypothetical protein
MENLLPSGRIPTNGIALRRRNSPQGTEFRATKKLMLPGNAAINATTHLNGSRHRGVTNRVGDARMPSGTYAASPYRTAERRLARLLSKPKGKAAQAVASGIVEAKGEAMFRHACPMGLEAIVSKRLGSPYVSGRTRAWLKSKNPKNCGLTCKYSLSWKHTCVIASEYAFRPAAITSGCKVSSEKQCL